MNDNLEEYDFTPSASTNLRSLFNSSSEVSEPSSLIYTAPKQPKPGATEVKSETARPETSVVSARVVQVWKLTDGKYIPMGKHGCAIIGSSIQNSFEMILYKEKRNVIMRAKISPEFEISLKKDDFASFYDSTKENWLIKFNDNEDCVTIVSKIENYGGKINKTTSEETKKQTQENYGGEKSEEHTPENKARNDILTRIAKMGQSILPNKSVDTREEVAETTDTKVSSLNTSREITSINSPTSPLNPANFVYTERTMPTVPNTVVITQPMGYDPLNVYVAENRAHNSELRMNLSQITEKLNCIMKFVDSGKSNHDPDDVSRSKIKVLELRTENLLRELDNVQKENIKLKGEMEHQDSALKRDKELEMEFKRLQEQKHAQIEELQRQVLLSESQVVEFSQLSETRKTEMEELRKQLSSYQEELLRVNEIPSLKQTISELQQKLIDCEEQHQQSHEKQPTDEDKEKAANFTSMLKEEMNGMYADIVSNFKDQNTSEVNSIIAQNIKSTTLKIIQNFQKIYHTQ